MSDLNPLAIELNDVLRRNNIYVHDMLSELGLRMYFPKGILSQGAEARTKAHKIDATIGIATEASLPMHLPSIQSCIKDISPKDSYDYAPAAGKAELRKAWLKKILEENPSLRDKSLSLPIVTSGLTHGLSISADLFVDPGDVVIVPDKLWENYILLFSVRYGARIETFPFYNADDGFNVQEFRNTLLRSAKMESKLIVLLNFPNNPTGYTPTVEEARGIVEAIQESAEAGCNILVICDDAYYGLFYEDDILRESIAGYVAGSHPRILTIKADAATKEEYVWGFRVGFLSFVLSASTNNEKIFNALERKVMGCIRSSISNCSNLSQTLVLEALKSKTFREEQSEKASILKARAKKVKEVLNNKKYNDAWDVYNFNSGYFMCLKLKGVNSEKLRMHMLEKYGIGVIALDDTDIRIAFSCVEEEKIEELFDTIYKVAKELS